jgi:hypothetical protein
LAATLSEKPKISNMSFFKKLFGGQDTPIQTNTSNTVIAEQKLKRSIFDFFQLDLKNLPDDNFIKAEEETNVSGDRVEFYRKTLNYKECGLYDTVEVRVIGGTNKNISFKCFDLRSVKMDALRKLIDDLYLIYGNDSSNKGKFTSKDQQESNDTDFYLLFGRNWGDYPKYKYPVSVGRDENGIDISIWGVGKD